MAKIRRRICSAYLTIMLGVVVVACILPAQLVLAMAAALYVSSREERGVIVFVS
jgi:hypothetical protein